jgi:hypothetical protein
MLAISPAYAASCVDLRDDSHKVTVRGTIEQSTTTEEGEGGTPPGRKYMSIMLDQPGCAANDEKSIAVDPVSVKWLGHHVAITGTVEPTGEGPYIAVKHIVEDTEHCTAEEQDYDASHRELLGMPPGECVKSLPDYPTRAAGWLAAVEVKAKNEKPKVWHLEAVTCDTPDPPRATCHGTQGFGKFPTKAECAFLRSAVLAALLVHSRLMHVVKSPSAIEARYFSSIGPSCGCDTNALHNAARSSSRQCRLGLSSG